MAAHTKPRPRARGGGSRRANTGVTPRHRLWRPEAFGLALAAAALVAVPFLFDVGQAAAATRDWLLRTFGFGLLILAALSIAGGRAVSHRAGGRSAPSWQRSAGVAALALFAWGALGFNRAHWQAGGVDFREATLGGEVGATLVAGLLGKAAWISLLIVGLSLVAPSAMRRLAVSAPGWVREAWVRRWPHRAAGGVARFVAFIFRRPGEEQEELVIGAGGRPLPVPRPVPAFEEAPMVFRPTLEPGSPASPLGTGAAQHFAPAPLEASAPAAAAALATESTAAPAAAESGDDAAALRTHQMALDLGLPGGGWNLPALELLNAPRVSVNRKHDNAARAQLIVDTLASFGVDATVVEINEGPSVTQFGVEPGWEVRHRDVLLRDENGRALLGPEGRPRTERVEVARTRVRVNRITALQNDLALALAAPSLRIEAPVPGRAVVGLEVPNEAATVVTLRHVMESKEFQDLARKSPLAMALGKGVSGVAIVADLRLMPHLLIAGATGSGKSVCVNSIICGIMMNATPDQVRFVLIDPKRVEMTAYNRMPHLAFSEVICDMDKVVATLQAVAAEMDARYKKFAAVGARNIEIYNNNPKVVRKLPYWVVVIDELADLMMLAPSEVERLLIRLAQLARATGIHLVVATQRPSVDIVTGTIKANFPTRIAFAMTSQVDSRTVLDTGGAEKLLGRGDMLFVPPTLAKPARLQGVYVSDGEVERLVKFWSDERFAALAPERADSLLEQALVERNGGEELEVAESDPLVEQARMLARQHQRISPSLLERRLKVGAVKAERLIHLLESEGVVGPREEGESRRVLAAAAEEVPS